MVYHGPRFTSTLALSIRTNDLLNRFRLSRIRLSRKRRISEAFGGWGGQVYTPPYLPPTHQYPSGVYKAGRFPKGYLHQQPLPS
jgi:hypothetical protein